MSDHAIALHEPKATNWVMGVPGKRPVVFAILLLLFALMVILPPPASLVDMVTEQKPAGAKLEAGTTTFVDSYNKLMKYSGAEKISAVEVAERAKVAVAMLLFAALLWGTEAIPLGATNFVVAIICYVFMLLPLDRISQAFFKDAVFFIGGVLCIAAGVSITGLDKRIGYILLGRVGGMKSFAFIFFPFLALLASFFSEHALVALMIPILLLVYTQACQKAGVKNDKNLAVFLFLGICFAGNVGGSGSPAVGGRAAVMVGYFADYGMPISFTQWMMYGLPLVPILAITTAVFMWLTCGRKVLAKNFNIAKTMKENVEGIGPLRGKELIMAILFGAQIILWLFFSGAYGLGGTTVMIVVAMLILGVVKWGDLQRRVPMDVVLLYAAACAIGTALNATGGALWMARQFLNGITSLMPNAEGSAVIIAVSLITVIITNFMSDGATVAAVGPVVLPMAAMAGVPLWKVGLATSFSSSFAHAMIVGTVNNAIAYTMARDPETGEPLLTVWDFFRLGAPFVVISILITWATCFWGYWNFLPWPAP
ncbi:MAG: SLC13 family permease [Bacillota bacterium]